MQFFVVVFFLLTDCDHDHQQKQQQQYCRRPLPALPSTGEDCCTVRLCLPVSYKALLTHVWDAMFVSDKRAAHRFDA